MAAEDPLGLPRRARGEHQASNVVRPDRHLGPRTREIGERRGGVPSRQREPRTAGFGKPGLDSGRRRPGRRDLYPGRRRGQTQDLDQPRRRVGRIQDGEGRPSREGPQHRLHQRRAAVGVDRYAVPPAGAVRGEPAGEPAARRGQLAVGPLPVLVDDRRARRLLAGTRREQLVHRPVPPGVERRGRVRQQESGAPRHQGESMERLVRLLDRLRQQRLELGEQILHPCGVEQVGVVDQLNADFPLAFSHIEGHVEFRRQAGDRQRRNPQPGQAQLARRQVQHVEEHLEERRPGRVALHPQAAEQSLERHVLMRIGAQGDLAYTHEQLA